MSPNARRNRMPRMVRAPLSLSAAMLSLLLAGCGDFTTNSRSNSPTVVGGGQNPICSIPSSLLVSGGPGKDGIPALTNPPLVRAGAPGSEYVRSEDRVIGIVVDGQAIAVPHNIGWWHEIVNLDVGDHQLAATFCPLTASSLVFDRGAIEGAELGVSGLLYLNNLVMYDRTTQESFWPQMLRGARCGPRDGTALEMFPAVEMTWAGWIDLHPETRVVADDPSRGRNYRQYPYGDYEALSNTQLLFPMDVDERRSTKERVLGIPVGEGGGIAFPFMELDRAGEIGAVHLLDPASREIVVFWDRVRGAATAHFPVVGDEVLNFFITPAGSLMDVETESTWLVDGRATDGPMAGQRLEPVAEAFVALWFAWAAFYPDAILWEFESGSHSTAVRGGIGIIGAARP